MKQMNALIRRRRGPGQVLSRLCFHDDSELPHYVACTLNCVERERDSRISYMFLNGHWNASCLRDDQQQCSIELTFRDAIELSGAVMLDKSSRPPPPPLLLPKGRKYATTFLHNRQSPPCYCRVGRGCSKCRQANVALNHFQLGTVSGC